jgi:hypothetical protein
MVKRTKELLKKIRAAGGRAITAVASAFVELFSIRKCHEMLREMYHSILRSIRDAL